MPRKMSGSAIRMIDQLIVGHQDPDRRVRQRDPLVAVAALRTGHRALQLELGQQVADVPALGGELVLQILEGRAPRADDAQLGGDVLDRLADDRGPRAVVRRRRRVPALAQQRPRVLGRNPLLELRQREPEQIPDPQQVAEAGLVGRVVQAVRPLGPVAAGQQADLLVVADGAWVAPTRRASSPSRTSGRRLPPCSF